MISMTGYDLDRVQATVSRSATPEGDRGQGGSLEEVYTALR